MCIWNEPSLFSFSSFLILCAANDVDTDRLIDLYPHFYHVCVCVWRKCYVPSQSAVGSIVKIDFIFLLIVFLVMFILSKFFLVVLQTFVGKRENDLIMCWTEGGKWVLLFFLFIRIYWHLPRAMFICFTNVMYARNLHPVNLPDKILDEIMCFEIGAKPGPWTPWLQNKVMHTIQFGSYYASFYLIIMIGFPFFFPLPPPVRKQSKFVLHLTERKNRSDTTNYQKFVLNFPCWWQCVYRYTIQSSLPDFCLQKMIIYF